MQVKQAVKVIPDWILEVLNRFMQESQFLKNFHSARITIEVENS